MIGEGRGAVRTHKQRYRILSGMRGQVREGLIEVKTWKLNKIYSDNVGMSMLGWEEGMEGLFQIESNVFKYVY